MSRRFRAFLLYVSVAYGVTWLVWMPYLVAALRNGPDPGPFLYYAAALGPFLGAVVAEGYERGGAGVRDLIIRLANPRRAGIWGFVGVGTPLLLVPLSAGPIWLATEAWPDWRGFLLPRLQAGRSALAATLLLVPIWAAWHLPAFWFREGYVGLGPAGTVGFLLGLAGGAVVLTALYNSSRGSVLAVALWHGTWNWLATADAFQGPWVALMSGLILAAAVVLLWRPGPRDLAPSARPVVPA